MLLERCLLVRVYDIGNYIWVCSQFIILSIMQSRSVESWGLKNAFVYVLVFRFDSKKIQVLLCIFLWFCEVCGVVILCALMWAFFAMFDSPSIQVCNSCGFIVCGRCGAFGMLWMVSISK